MPENDFARVLVDAAGPALRGYLAEPGGALPIVTFRAATGQRPVAPGIVGGIPELARVPLEGGLEAELVEARLSEAVATHRSNYGRLPRALEVPGVGVFASGSTWAGADDLYRSFVGRAQDEQPAPLTDPRPGRASGKVAVVTGAAQGFGLEIAQDLAGEGAHVVLADRNVEGVKAAAHALSAEHGTGVALGLAMDVTSASSVSEAVHEVVRAFGGFDLLVVNAGVLRAGSVTAQAERDFDLTTAVNYKGYFLCARSAVPVMASQHRALPGYWGDIIQVNSKSGLQGSNKNFAYAGSKFGGIGLTQSFALELVELGIKVNSICPGNFFDGPLWSDPEAGLFVQYLRAGKVPGARTVEEVRRFYEEKVPMGRGCTSADVMKALYYLMDQDYETGQALPVTGGQVMLH